VNPDFGAAFEFEGVSLERFNGQQQWIMVEIDCESADGIVCDEKPVFQVPPSCPEGWEMTSISTCESPSSSEEDIIEYTLDVLASEAEVGCSRSPSNGWNNYGNQDSAEDCASMCGADLTCAAISYNHQRGQCTGYEFECVIRENLGVAWTLININRNANEDSDVETTGMTLEDSEDVVESDLATLQAEHETLTAQVGMLQEKMDMLFEYLQCSIEEGCGRFPSSQPSVAPSRYAAPYIRGMKCPVSGGDRSFRIQGSWVNSFTCAGTCAKRDDCAFISLWEPENNWPMCIGCSVAPKEYDPRFLQSYEIYGRDPNFCEIDDMSISGRACDRSREQVLYQQTEADIYLCLESCSQHELCKYIEFTWYDEKANGKSGWCRGLSRCDFIPSTDQSSRAKTFSVGEKC